MRVGEREILCFRAPILQYNIFVLQLLHKILFLNAPGTTLYFQENLETLPYSIQKLEDKQGASWKDFKKAKEYGYSPEGDRITEVVVRQGFTLHWKVHENSASESTRNAYFNLERLSSSSRLARPGISTMGRLLKGFDSDAELFKHRT